MTAPAVFVDTGAWAAVQIPDDEHHTAAATTLEALLARPAILVTTNHVVGETYTLLRVTQGHAAATRFVTTVEETTRLERVFVSEEIEREGFALLAQYADQDFSFVDATSFRVMRSRRLGCAFAFDSHFATAGFLRVPADVAVADVT